MLDVFLSLSRTLCLCVDNIITSIEEDFEGKTIETHKIGLLSEHIIFFWYIYYVVSRCALTECSMCILCLCLSLFLCARDAKKSTQKWWIPSRGIWNLSVFCSTRNSFGRADFCFCVCVCSVYNVHFSYKLTKLHFKVSRNEKKSIHDHFSVYVCWLHLHFHSGKMDSMQKIPQWPLH